jgi:two-component system, NtrC family, response regulator AtoC
MRRAAAGTWRAPGLATLSFADPSALTPDQLVARVAATTISVLVLGETGAGKEVLAERIHRASPRAGQPFVRLNCATFSSTLLESELFGHEKGAFTGAATAKVGLLESACGGTVFLDEVGELPAPVQAKLLRVLEEREILPIGAVRARSVDVRFVAATNRDLQADSARGAFRADLYFRLDGITLYVPPLRARRTEIEPLARMFLDGFGRRVGRAVPGLSARAIAALHQHAWPGNVRELKNVMERAALICDEPLIEPHHLALGPAAFTIAGAVPPTDDPRELERRRIVEVLHRCGGNQTRAARLLGHGRRTLLRRLDELGLPRPRKEPP